MEGAMSSVDTFEYKPELDRSNGKAGPAVHHHRFEIQIQTIR